MATRKTQTTAKPSTARKAAAQPANKPAAKPAPRKASRPAAEESAKADAKPAAKAPAKAPVKAATPKKPENKAVKARKPKMVRDSFTMPKPEYAAIDTLKARATQAGRPAKKSELLRAGVKLLESLTPADLLAALQALPAIKTGRPAKAR